MKLYTETNERKSEAIKTCCRWETSANLFLIEVMRLSVVSIPDWKMLSRLQSKYRAGLLLHFFTFSGKIFWGWNNRVIHRLSQRSNTGPKYESKISPIVKLLGSGSSGGGAGAPVYVLRLTLRYHSRHWRFVYFRNMWLSIRLVWGARNTHMFIDRPK